MPNIAEEQRKKKALALLLLLRKRKADKSKRSFWVHPIQADRKRFGEYYHLMPELRKDDQKFFEYLRMDMQCFELLKTLLGNRYFKEFCIIYHTIVYICFSLSKTSMREPIGPEERLVVTLRFLATGNSFRSLSFSYRLGRKTVADIVAETCTSIYDVLSEKYLRTPSTPEEWLNIAEGFWKRWNSPNTLGMLFFLSFVDIY